MKKLLLFLALSISLGCHAQSRTDEQTQMAYVDVVPYLRDSGDVDSVYTMWIVSTTFNGTSASCWYSLRGKTGNTISLNYFSIDGDNYTAYRKSKWDDDVLMDMLSEYCKNTIK